MKKILCIGEALIDMICTDKGSSLSDGNNFLKKAGGAPTNVAAAIAALGGNVELAAKVGADPFGKHLIDVMQSFGLSTKWVIHDEFSIVHFGSATGFLPGPLQAAYQGLMQKALQKNIFISFDPNYRQLLFRN